MVVELVGVSVGVVVVVSLGGGVEVSLVTGGSGGATGPDVINGGTGTAATSRGASAKDEGPRRSSPAVVPTDRLVRTLASTAPGSTTGAPDDSAVDGSVTDPAVVEVEGDVA